MKSSNRIMFAGPSGSGKTTLTQFVHDVGDYTFLSGSVSDLLPQTKDESHLDMLSHDKKELYQQDFQILNLRNKLYSKYDRFVSDRSYLDSAAYFLYKQSDSIPQCEVEHFLELCKKCLCSQCDHLFLLDFTPYMIKNWVMEDNNKRILNKYFQAQISSIMKLILDDWGVKFTRYTQIPGNLFHFSKPLELGGYSEGILNTIYGSVDITIIYEPELTIRENIISKTLGIKV